MVNFIGPDFAHTIIAAKGGIAKLNKYRILLPTMSVGEDAISMDVLCRRATLPGRSITTVPRRVNMKSFETPTGYINTPVDMAFTESNDHTVSRYFDRWMNSAVDPVTYAVAYRKDLVRDIYIMATNDSGVPTYIVKLRGAFPKVKTQIDLSDNSENSVVEIQIQIEYEDYEVMESALLSGGIDLLRAVQGGSFPSNVIRDLTRGLF